MATSVAGVKTSVDAAIVAIGGKAGEKISNDWLIRGFPVLMEHPVGPLFLAKVWRRGGRIGRLHINGHFCELPTVVKFIQVCREATRGHGAYSAVIVATPRTLYSCLDIALALLPSRGLARIRFRRPELNALGDPEFHLGPMRLRVNLMSDTSSDDDAAGSLGGHFIQLWLPDRRIALVSPTGPIITLGTDALRTATWTHSGRSNAPSWNTYDSEERPAALIAALDRMVRASPRSSHKAQLRRPLLVSRVWNNVIRPRGF